MEPIKISYCPKCNKEKWDKFVGKPIDKLVGNYVCNHSKREKK